MSAPAITLGSDASLASVISLLESRAISAVPLVDGGRLVGIVSTTDAVGALPAGDDAAPVAARDRMTSPVLTVHPDEPLDDAARRLVRARVHRLVVVDDDDAVVGVLSARDALAEVKRQRIRVPSSAS
jgi:CBS domain-containing protein